MAHKIKGLKPLMESYNSIVDQWTRARWLESRIANAEEFDGFTEDDRLRPPPTRSGGGSAFEPRGLLRQAIFSAIRATGVLKAFQEASDEMQTIQTEQAAGKVLIVRDIPYVDRASAGNLSKQSCDIYLPKHGERHGRPLVVHFHGGGWVRGDRRDEFRGAPAVARAHAAAGCVVVTPSYRLGSSEHLMADAQQAVLWARENAKSLGADPDRLYLSGHSAGGNIATLLAVGPWLAPPVLPTNAIKGVIGISGVYTLLKPLGGPLNGVKNKIYDNMYRLKVFGTEVETLARHSPTALLRLASGASEPFKKPACALLSDAVNKCAWDVLSAAHITSGMQWSSSPHGAPAAKGGGESVVAGVAAGGGGSMDNLPPVMLINASWDLGLEADATYFAKLLEASTGAKPAHHIVPGTNHTTISWSETAFRHCRDFIEQCEAGRGDRQSATAAAVAAAA